MPRTTLRALALLQLTLATALFAQTPAAPAASPAALTVPRVFSSEFSARGVGQLRWIEGGTAFLTVEPAPGGRGREIVRHETATDARTVLVTAAQLTPPGANAPLAFQSFAWSNDNTKLLLFTNTTKVWRLNTRGDYWVLDRTSNTLKQIGGDAKPSTLMFATFSPDGQRVAYVREHDLYAEELATGAVTRLTHDGSRTSINGTSDWVYEEELGIRQAFQWSPDSKRLLFWHFDASAVRDFLLINNTDSLYPSTTPIPYPKAGTTNSRVTLGVVAPTGGAVTWLDVVGDTATSYIGQVEWLDATSILVQHLNRKQNRNDFWVGDAVTGRGTVLYTDADSAWVEVQELRWIATAPGVKRGKGAKGAKGAAGATAAGAALVESERDGWRHVYAVHRATGATTLLTPGDYDATITGVDERGGILYVMASPGAAAQLYLYRVPLTGGAATRVTPADQPGTHRYDIAPDGRWALHTVSRFDQPPRTEIIRLPGHEVVRVLEDNAALRTKLAALGAPATEFFTVTTAQGLPVDGYVMRPTQFDATKQYPVLVHIYGEPAGMTAADRWGGSAALFHRMIADQGYLVMSFDTRGTPAPKGRAWRKGIYGAVGATTAAEQAAALRAYAATHAFVDTSRVAIWGWSGGGTNTLNAMFREPDVFKVGMSVAPVPDQRLYDTIYQERYMGLPQDNVAGYQLGSAINHAEGLKGRLLVVHGTGDDNVHYQGTERLINRMVTLGKRFDVMVYPNRTHSISEGDGTTVHIHTLLQRYLRENLPAGGREAPPKM
ncbi:MAG: DPP IV N-terminal domain-containing protein [Gemmatimonadetes bacterium]|nr:DPP IV N-terminal domain-containing protein [Gemmatimonadota bacterium]